MLNDEAIFYRFLGCPRCGWILIWYAHSSYNHKTSHILSNCSVLWEVFITKLYIWRTILLWSSNPTWVLGYLGFGQVMTFSLLLQGIYGKFCPGPSNGTIIGYIYGLRPWVQYGLANKPLWHWNFWHLQADEVSPDTSQRNYMHREESTLNSMHLKLHAQPSIVAYFSHL